MSGRAADSRTLADGKRNLTAPLVLAPTAAGCPRAPGLMEGPAAVFPLLDVGRRDVTWLDIARRPISSAAAEVAAAAERAAAAGHVPVVVGGDHTVALGGVAGVARALRTRFRKSKSKGANATGRKAEPPLFLLWLDAHPDVNTPETSPTGNPHGMVLRALLGEGPYAINEPLSRERVVLAGVRAFDPGELGFLQAPPPLVVWDVEWLRGDSWRDPLSDLLQRVARHGGRLYVSVDLDVFDPAVAPGVVVPAPHGALVEPVLELLRTIRRSGRLAGADVVELYPPSDSGPTAALAARVVEALALAEDRDASGGNLAAREPREVAAV